MKDLMLRDALLNFLGVKQQKNYAAEYCAACKKFGKADCESCSKKLDVIYS
jgi:hypothetical protein